MARRVRDKDIETREARRKLKPSGKPFWLSIGKGLHVGYRKGKTGGVWVVRHFIGDQDIGGALALAASQANAPKSSWAIGAALSTATAPLSMSRDLSAFKHSG